MDKVLEILQFLRKRVYFVDGLIALLIVSGLVYRAIGEAVGRHLVLLLKALGCPVAIEYFRGAFMLGFLIIATLAYFFWRRLRAVPRCHRNELGIFFAPNPSTSTQDEMDRLFVHLKQEIKSREVGIRFSLKRLPQNLSVDSPEDAVSILREARAVAAVWGPVEQQQTDQGKTTGFSKFSVTFVHRPALVHFTRHEALAMSLVGRQLYVRERTQIADQHLMAKDIGIIVRNVLGVVLLIDQRYSDAAKILGPLYFDLQGAFPGKMPLPIQRFCLQVQFDLAYALTMATGEEYQKWLWGGKLYEIPATTLTSWLKNVDQALFLDSQNCMHYLTKAIYLFLRGDVQEAIISEQKADQLAPRAASVANLGLAFLYNFIGDFLLSRDQYRLGLDKKTSYDEDTINQCIAFISQSITRFPEKKQLQLALGILQLHRGTIDRAQRAFKALLDNPPIEPDLHEFVNEATRLLEQARIQQEKHVI